MAADLTKPISFDTWCRTVEHMGGLERREDDTAA